jgi:lipid A 3-O-deacylase
VNVGSAAAVMIAVLFARAGWAQDWPELALAPGKGFGHHADKTPHGSNAGGERHLHGALAAAESDGEPAAGEGLGGILSEVRLGVLDHNFGLLAKQREEGLDVNFELLFVAPQLLEITWLPRPHVGVTVSTEGNTSFLYAGGTLDIPGFLDQVFGWQIWQLLLFEGALGLALHDGELNGSPAQSPANALGCRVLFREALSLGVRFWKHHSLSLSVDHMSNAGICDDNDGLSTLGLRYGYRF